jgi:hypothetical protein
MRPYRQAWSTGLVPVECFSQFSRQQPVDIISFGIWSESEKSELPVHPSRSLQPIRKDLVIRFCRP